MNSPEKTSHGISSALVRAQKAFGPALKTSSNPHFKSRYADLSACVEAVIDALNANGIALIQKTHECEIGVAIETVFVHESGETMSSGILRVPASKQDAQGYGSAMTYARRYSLMAACGIAPEEDDGNAASKTKPAAQSAKSVAAATLDAFTPEEKHFLKDTAMEVLAHLPDEAAMYDAYCAAKKKLDADEQVGFWAFFDSKSRSAIKRQKDAELANTP